MISAAALLDEFRARGIAVEVRGDRLRLTPADRMTAADLEAVRSLKMELIGLLGAQRMPAPDGPCHGCGMVAWFVASDWPTAGESRWLCRTRCAQPARFSSLPEAYASLSAAERDHLRAEAEAGDPLAVAVLAAVTAPEPASSPPGAAFDGDPAASAPEAAANEPPAPAAFGPPADVRAAEALLRGARP